MDARAGAGRLMGRVGAALLAIVVLAAIFAPLLTDYGPHEQVAASGIPPSWQHPLGTNDIGHDLFTQWLYGARMSVSIGLLSAAFALTVGLTLALVGAYRGGLVDAVSMRLVDLTIALPFIPLVLVVAAFLGRGFAITVLVIGGVIWAQAARVLRSQMLKIVKYGHVQAAEAMGLSTARILGRHLLPRVAPLAAGQFVRAANVAISIEASLSFLGLGDPNRVSWGSMLFFAHSHNAVLTDAWLWWILPPGLGLTAVIVSLAFIGYAIEESGDRRLAGGSQGNLRRWRVAKADEHANPDANEPGTTLRVRDLHVHYETPTATVRAVDGVSLDALVQRTVGLVGESGCGKTTLVMTLLGLIPYPGRIVGGSIRIAGQEATRLSPVAIRKLRGRTISLVPQGAMNSLNPAYTVHRQIAEAARLAPRDADEASERADELLRLVELPSEKRDAYPHELSGGMRQRAVLAMALANDPELVVADEPFTGLDVLTQAAIVNLMLDLKDRLGITLLVVSHDLPLLTKVVDDLYVMYAGQIVEFGPAAEITKDPQHPYTEALLNAFPSLRGPQPELVTLPGLPPDLRHPPQGCRFQPRCALAQAACTQTAPSLTARGPERAAACLLERS